MNLDLNYIIKINMSIISPTNNTSLIITDFINYATSHLSTVSGLVNTVSLYPPLATPGPGVLPWASYSVVPPSPVSTQLPNTDLEMTLAQSFAADSATMEGANINDSTSEGFQIPPDAPPPSFEDIQNNEENFDTLILNEPDPVLNEEDKPKNDIERVPNYKTNVKVPNEIILAMRKYNIGRDAIERAHILSQCEHESGGWNYKYEVWGPTATQSGYEGRDDLGNNQKGDGYKYRGRGYIQLTGKANYKAYSKSVGADILNSPDLVATTYFAETPCLYWIARKLSKYSTGAETSNIKAITKKINGGFNGLSDRIKKFTKYWTELQKDETLWS
jgi:putative chitinase